jgi:dTDP-4-amino-4,6-dideoxygalactose transaminase
VTELIYLSSPDVGEAEERAVAAAIRSGWVAPLGPEVDAFEAEMAARVGVAHGVALSSGTAALHLGLLALGAGPGSVVITASMTFAATANAITYTGAEPYFVDSDPVTGNLDLVLLERALARLIGDHERVAAIVPVDLFGKCVDYAAVEAIAAQYRVPVFADAAESLGASHAGRAAGSFGRASAVSFNGNKIMTTSGGGMLLTDDQDLAAYARYLSTQARQPVAHYEHTEVGYNYRMSNVLAALGRVQLARLDEMIACRRSHRERYKRLFAGCPGVTIFGGDGDEPDNTWLTGILVDRTSSGWSTGELSEWLAGARIESRPFWKPMHLQPVFASARAELSGASEQLFATGLMLPSGSALTTHQTARIDERIASFLRRA